MSEAKLRCFFPNAQFIIEGYSPPFIYDRNSNGGGILFSAREDISLKIINKSLSKNFEGFFVELNVLKWKSVHVFPMTHIKLILQSSRYSRKNIGY